jgi:hypothetical protein
MNIEKWISVSRGYLLGTAKVVQTTSEYRSDDREERRPQTFEPCSTEGRLVMGEAE